MSPRMIVFIDVVKTILSNRIINKITAIYNQRTCHNSYLKRNSTRRCFNRRIENIKWNKDDSIIAEPIRDQLENIYD